MVEGSRVNGKDQALPFKVLILLVHKVGIKQRQPGMGKHPLMRWDRGGATLSIVGSAGAKFLYTLFDNSSLGGGKYLKIGKMTIRWFANLNQQALT